ncbi:MAG TPA: hypothetical protein VH255_10490, partial [Verrucomicrobiae bacterium]|nr:hypothetical protein [Verrucomicrobiae bacterium]
MNRTTHFILLSAILAWLPISQLYAKELADYRVGDTVETDIVAPEKFLVVDPQATDALKRREGDRLPMIARYYPEVSGEAEAALLKTFANARNNFLNLGETQFKHHLPDPNASDELIQSVMDWPGLDKSFPLSAELAGLWARGQSDEAFLNSLTAELHVAMQQYIFPAQAPAGWHTGNAARLIALTNTDIIPTPQLVDEKGFTVTRS